MTAREIAVLGAGFLAGAGTLIGVTILIAVAAWKDIRG